MTEENNGVSGRHEDGEVGGSCNLYEFIGPFHPSYSEANSKHDITHTGIF